MSMDDKTHHFRHATRLLKQARQASRDGNSERVLALFYLVKLCIGDLERLHACKRDKTYFVTKERELEWAGDDRPEAGLPVHSR